MTDAVLDPVMVQSGDLAGGLNREEILKQIFGDIGELIEDFTCAVESTVLLHGRMYITNRFICFYSNLFGLEKKIRIPYSHIKNITKESTAYMIPNAISISTDKRNYLFRSFWDREDCFRILTAFWEKYKLGGSASISLSRLRMNTPNNVPPSSAPFAASTTGNAANGGANTMSPNPTPAITAPTINAPTSTAQPSTETEIAPSEGQSRRASTRRGSTPNGSPLEGEDEMDAESGFRSDRPMSVVTGAVSKEELVAQFNAEVTKNKLKHLVVSGVFEIGLNDFENLFVNENAPYSYQRYHESVKDTNLVVSPWSTMSATLGAGREIKFFKPVNLPGLASTRGVKLQRFRRFGDYGLMVFSSTRLEDVPAADTFSVDDLVCVNVAGDGKINVEITFQVTFLKSTYMKYIIERSTNVEMMKWLEVFFNHLKKISEQFKKGEVTLENAEQLAIAESIPVPTVTTSVESKSAVESIPAASAVAMEAKAVPGQNYLSWVVVGVLVLYIILNQWRWSATSSQIADLQVKMQALETALAGLGK